MIGVIGVSWYESQHIPISTVFCIMEEYNKHQYDQYKQEWERVRWSVFASAAPPKRKGRISVYDYIEFPWEKETKTGDVRNTIAMLKEQGKIK